MNRKTKAAHRMQDTAPSTVARWQGRIDGVRDGILYGWAVDPDAPQARVVVEVLLDGDALGCATADVARPDVRLAMPDCCHGFVFDIPALAGASSGGVLRVRVANTDVELDGMAILDRSAASTTVGATTVMADGGLRLVGWSTDPHDSGRRARVRAFVGAECVAEARAERWLPFMRGRVDAPHGFVLDLPPMLADGRPHEVRVVDERGQALAGSPVLVCVAEGGARTLLAPGQALLGDVIATYERSLPRSAGLAHYVAWARRFETAARDGTPGAVADRTAAPDAAIIVAGASGHAETVVSLARQVGGRCLAIAAAPGADGFRAAVQRALASGAGWVACVRAGDVLVEHALAQMREAFALDGADVVYSDSETVLDGGAPQPWFKPAWNPEYALGSDYPLAFMGVRSDALRAALAGTAPDNAAQLAWCALRAVWSRGTQAIVHVPRVLYRGTSALDAGERAQRHAAAAAALRALEPAATLEPFDCAAPDMAARRLVRPPAALSEATVSLIVPTRDQLPLLQRCIDSLLKHAARPGLEIIIADNDSARPETHAYFRRIARHGVRVVPVPGGFNFSRINNQAVAAARGEIIGLVNNDIEAVHAGWLDEMLGHLAAPGVGAVGAKLMWPNGMVQHGGVVLGVGDVAGHYGNHLAEADPGDHARNQLAQQVSAVTAACLLVRKADYLALGRLDEAMFPVAFNDVDFCLRLRARGAAIVWTPWARLVHAESASRGQDDAPHKRARAQREVDGLRRRWGHVLCADPAYHPSLNLDVYTPPFTGLALPPRTRAPRRAVVAAPRTDAVPAVAADPPPNQ